MKRKFIFGSMIVMVVLLVGFVVASRIETQIKFNEGWNLVTGFFNPEQLNENYGLLHKNIKAVYILKQPTQEYVRIYPNPEKDKLEGIDDDYYEQTAQWVYADKDALTYYTVQEPLPIEEHQLYKGWNFVAITPVWLLDYQEGRILKMIADGPEPRAQDLVGTCDIGESYFFNSEQQRWEEFPPSEQFAEKARFMGWVVKVRDDCHLEISGTGDGPPELPEDEEIFIPSAAVISVPFYANAWNAKSDENKIKIELKNKGGETLTISDFEISDCGSTSNLGEIESGATKLITISCSPALIEGEIFKGNITIIYTKPSSSLELTATGFLTEIIA